MLQTAWLGCHKVLTSATTAKNDGLTERVSLFEPSLDNPLRSTARGEGVKQIQLCEQPAPQERCTNTTAATAHMGTSLGKQNTLEAGLLQ